MEGGERKIEYFEIEKINFQCWAGEMAWWVKVIATKLTICTWFPKPTWQDITNSENCPHLHTCAHNKDKHDKYANVVSFLLFLAASAL